MSAAHEDERAEPARAPVPPVPAGAPRPRWSVMIPTYDCAAPLRETLASVLAQAPGPDAMQIEVVDDHSTQDDPERVVAEVGGGRVGFYRQPRNVGHVRNFDTCLARARGELVHLLHGDDQVLPGFYEAMGAPFEAEPALGMACCRHVFTDEEGHWQAIGHLLQETPGYLTDWLPRIAAGQQLQTPSVVVRRAVYERLGGFDRRLVWTEDWEMWVRIAAHYPVWYEPTPLAVYRVRAGSLSSRARRSGRDVRDLADAIAVNHASLPPAEAERLTRRARAQAALGALRRAERAAWIGERRMPLAQLGAAVRLSPTAAVLGGAARLLGVLGLAVARRGRPLR